PGFYYHSQQCIASTKPITFQVIFACLLVFASCTCKIANKKFTGDKTYYLNHTGKMSYENRGTPTT
ncbi:unnamed protein product, partial [Bubo scandiacus]